MGRSLRLLLSVVLLMAGATWLVEGFRPAQEMTPREARPALSASESTPAPPSVPSMTQTQDPPSPTDSGALYRWRDASGRVHVSSSPPEPGVESDWVRRFSVQRSDGAQLPKEGANASNPPESDTTRSPGLRPLDVYSPEGLRELRQRAGQVADELEARRRLMRNLDDDL